MFLSQIIMHPPTIPEIAAAVTSPREAAEVYLTARLAIDLDAPTEREWPDRLALALCLEPDLKAHLRRSA